MSVKIRLRRMGKKKQPHYRIVVADSRAPRDGRFVEILGHYSPVPNPAELVVDLERVDYWLGEGAEPSDTVASLVAKARAGGDDKVALGPVGGESAEEEDGDGDGASGDAVSGGAAADAPAEEAAAAATA